MVLKEKKCVWMPFKENDRDISMKRNVPKFNKRKKVANLWEQKNYAS